MKAQTIMLIERELIAARLKFPGNHHKLAALVEEVGELAEAMLDNKPRSRIKEAAQVAAMAIRILEEGDSDFDSPGAETIYKPDSPVAEREAFLQGAREGIAEIMEGTR